MCVTTLIALCSPSGAAATPTATPTPSATLPPSLVTLEQKMSELQLSSMRFSLETTIVLPHLKGKAGKLLKVLKLFGGDSRISGEITTQPEAGNLSLQLFGHKFVLRYVQGTGYLYSGKLAREDHGRPWVKLGPGGLDELITGNGHPAREGAKTTKPESLEPKLAEPPFTKLTELLNGAEEVRELGPTVRDGQPVTRFLATLEPAQLRDKALESTAHSALAPRPPPTRPTLTATLEVALASNGVPVRTAIKADTHGTSTTITLEIPAVNFPLVIQAPPAAKTISLRRLREMEKQAKTSG